MKFVSYLRLLFKLTLSVFILSQCSILSPGKKNQVPVKQQALAYFVPEQRTEFVGKKSIKVKGDLNKVVDLISELMRDKTGANTSVIRNQNIDASFNGTRDLLKVATSPIVVDSLGAFKENFLLGYYLLEDPSYLIKPDNMNYKVEAGISVRGQDLLIEFKLVGSVLWDVYAIQKKGKLKKQSTEFKHSIGVGVYKSQKEIKKLSRVGNEITDYEDVVVPVKDQPISKGTLELKMIDMLMEKFAINDFTASVLLQ
ncbi:hypothetical protein EP331_03490 [bacterium]|nr:MAG: hypothetical protein EP331_03490 [bacterium]